MFIFASFLLLIVSTSFAVYFLIRGFSYFFIYRDPASMWINITAPLIVLFVCVAITCIIAYYIIQPFDSVVRRVRKGGEKPSDAEKNKCLAAYRKIAVLLFASNFVGFFLGQIIVVLLRKSPNPVFSSMIHIIVTIVYSVSAGSMAAGIEILGLNEILVPYRKMLEIHTVESFNERKAFRFATSTYLMFFISMFYVCINIAVVPFGLIYQLQTSSHRNAIGTFLSEVGIASIFALVPPMIIMRIVLNGFSKRIDENIKRVHDIANNGDLTSRLNLAMMDDYGSLSGAINVLIKQLSLMFKDLKNDTDVVSETSDILTEVTDSAQSALSGMIEAFKSIDSDSKSRNELIYTANKDVDDLIQDVEVVKTHILEQTSAIQENSASITQMSSNIASVAEMTRKADEVSTLLTQTSSKGNNAINSAITSIEQIQSMSHEVQGIVKIIQKIASQTNLLSMNAAIEAAHAGSMGQGFAVVADEVRSLASSSAKSAKDIQEKIKEMVAKIDGGVEAIAVAGRSFREMKKMLTIPML
jgi:methyl-accepting chemotaxis protein